MPDLMYNEEEEAIENIKNKLIKMDKDN